jgi:transposase InsO family protein
VSYSVIAIVLFSSVPGKAYLAVCSIALLVSPKLEARVLIEDWRREYNQVKLHSSLGYRQPAPEAKIPVTLT